MQQYFLSNHTRFTFNLPKSHDLSKPAFLKEDNHIEHHEKITFSQKVFDVGDGITSVQVELLYASKAVRYEFLLWVLQ